MMKVSAMLGELLPWGGRVSCSVYGKQNGKVKPQTHFRCSLVSFPGEAITKDQRLGSLNKGVDCLMVLVWKFEIWVLQYWFLLRAGREDLVPISPLCLQGRSPEGCLCV
jgi:hypothetical protein